MANSCKYHTFVQTADYPEAVKEVCTRCGHREIYKKVDGKIDNNKYARDHIADFCQPFGATRKVYLEIYGEKNIKANKETNEQQRTTNETRKMMAEAKKDHQAKAIWKSDKDNLRKLVL